jgi:NADP-dependent 3-hydroxy acid dehydrogenase YdfG
MSHNIIGKVVVITGASSGLGEATARHLAGEGAKRFCRKFSLWARKARDDELVYPASA